MGSDDDEFVITEQQWSGLENVMRDDDLSWFDEAMWEDDADTQCPSPDAPPAQPTAEGDTAVPPYADDWWITDQDWKWPDDARCDDADTPAADAPPPAGAIPDRSTGVSFPFHPILSY